jgi:hypothetical protein
MSKKIKLKIPNKVKPNLHTLFHLWIDRVAKSRKKSYCANGFYTRDEIRALIDSGFFSIEDFDDDADYVFPYSEMNHDDDLDAYEEYWKNQERKQRRHNNLDLSYGYEKKGKRKRHKKGKCKVVDINQPYSGWEDYPSEIDVDYDGMSYQNDDEEEYKKYKEAHASDLDERPRYDDKLTIWYYPEYMNKYDRLEFNTLKDFDDFCADEGILIPIDVAEEIAFKPISHVCSYVNSRDDYGVAVGESYYEMLEAAEAYSEI